MFDLPVQITPDHRSAVQLVYIFQTGNAIVILCCQFCQPVSAAGKGFHPQVISRGEIFSSVSGMNNVELWFNFH